MYLLEWDGARSAGPEQAGGKGWNLGRLHRYGFPVPHGGVVSAEAYRLFMNHPDILERTRRLEGIDAAGAAAPGTAAALDELRHQIRATPLPAAVAGELHAFLAGAGLLDRPVAVRSSATAEDSTEASFAGIHQSFLNVTGLANVVDALKGCYASLWTPQALAYRRKLGLPDESVAAAVVVLAMVPARAAGVAFSCDPRTGRRDRVAISASLGLGEAVVSGAVEPDEYLADITRYPPAVVSRRIGRKSQATVAREEGGTELAEVAGPEAARPALSDEQLAELTYLVVRIQDALGELEQPQDVEWAHDGERFWLLQARPVTRLPLATFPAVADQPVIWSNANLKDVMPGVQSTLGWSFFRSGIDTLIAAPLLGAGYPYPGGVIWARLFRGRPYFNLSAVQWSLYDSLGMSPGEVNRVMGGHQPEIAVPPPTVAKRVRRLGHMTRLVARTLSVMRQAPAEFRRVWDWAEVNEAADLPSWENQAFLAKCLEAKALLDDFLPKFQLINGAAGGNHQELIRSLEPAFGDRAPGLANALLAGTTGITSAEQGERLVALGNLALREEAARAYFEADDWEPLRWRERLAGTRFASGFETYLRDYGHRGVYELELMNPRWKEDPTYLLDTVRAQVRSGKEIRPEGAPEKRAAAAREVFGKLGYSPRGLRVRYFLKLTARAAAQREMAKSVVVKAAGVTRYLTLEVGRRMATGGLLDAPEDIFHLSWVDMEAYLLDRPGPEGFKALVEDRKQVRERHLRQDPPDVIIGEQPARKAPPPAATGPVLTGIGVASGRASGVARVIRHPHEGGQLGPGEVLVAPSTDPAWTPLFLRASAVVMEVGGYLSHGAIVAREYGLPAVVNIPGLLQTVHDGESLTVDGDEGKVYR